jgi:hypothetical protein
MGYHEECTHSDKSNSYLQGDRVYEVSILAEVEAVQADEPVRGGNQFGEQ